MDDEGHSGDQPPQHPAPQSIGIPLGGHFGDGNEGGESLVRHSRKRGRLERGKSSNQGDGLPQHAYEERIFMQVKRELEGGRETGEGHSE